MYETFRGGGLEEGPQLSRERLEVGRGKEAQQFRGRPVGRVRPRLDLRVDEVREQSAAHERRSEFFEVAFPHPSEPIEALRPVGRDGTGSGGGGHAVGQQRSAGESVGSAARMSPDGETREMQRVRDRSHVAGGIGDRPLRAASDPPYPGRS